MKKIFAKNKKLKSGFSLIELSIVIVIVSILVTAGITVSINGANNSKVKITNDRINTVYKALGVFLIKNGRLPCPASLKLIKTAAAYGAEGVCALGAAPAANTGIYQSSTITDLFYGMVPIAALGLPNEMGEDAWGSKLTYIVNYNMAAATNISTPTAGFGGTGTSNLITIKEIGSAVQNAIVSGSGGAAFVIVSHGSNKAGAFNSTSSAQNTRATNNEAENDANIGASTGGQVAFDINIIYSSVEDGFDDIVFYKTRNQLVNDFNMLSLIVCQATASSETYGTINWPAAKYGQVVSAAFAATPVQCPSANYSAGKGSPKYPARRCGAFGNWSDIINPCITHNL